MSSETSKDSPLAIYEPKAQNEEQPPNLVTPDADASQTFFPKERPAIEAPKEEPAPVVAVVTPDAPDEAATPEVPSSKLAAVPAAPPMPQVAKLATAPPMPLPLQDQPEAKLAPAPSLRKRSRALLNGDAASSLDERVRKRMREHEPGDEGGAKPLAPRFRPASRDQYFVPFVQEALAKSGKCAEEHLDEFCAFVEAQGCRIKSDLFGAFARHCANQESMTESVFKNCCKWMQKNLEWQCQKKGLPAPKAHVAKLPAVKATMGTLREQGALLKAERAARDRERQPIPEPPAGGRRSRPRQPSARALESYDAAPPALSRARSAPTPRAVLICVEFFSLATECRRASSKTRRVDGVGVGVLRRRRRCAIDARHATTAQAPPPPLPQVSANPAAAFQPLYSGQVRLVDVPQMSLAELRALWAPVPDLQRSASAPIPPPPAMPANFNFDAPVTGGWELPPGPGAPPGSY